MLFNVFYMPEPVITISAGMRVLNPGWSAWPSCLDVFVSSKLMPRVDCPVLVMHVSLQLLRNCSCPASQQWRAALQTCCRHRYILASLTSLAVWGCPDGYAAWAFALLSSIPALCRAPRTR